MKLCLQIWVRTALSTALVWCCGVTQADEGANANGLAAMARAARGSFRQPAAAQFDQQLAALRTVAGALDRYLVEQGPNGEAWRKYLLWEVLSRQLVSTQPSPRELSRVNARFSSGENGLEMPIFSDVQQALANLLPTARLIEQPTVREEYVARVDELATLLQELAQRLAADLSTSEDRRERVGQILGWLEEYGQAADLVAAVRRQLSQPNLLIRVSRTMLAAEVDKPVNQTGPVLQSVLGSIYSGTARTIGRTELTLIPDTQRAVVAIRFTGTSDANTSAEVGGGRGTVYSHTVTSFEVNKRVKLDARGIELKPSQAQARITSDNSSVAAGGLGWRFAQRRVDEARPQAEAESARSSERELSQQFDGMVAQLLRDVVGGLPTGGGKPAAWRRPNFPQLQFKTTTDQLEVAGIQADPFQLAAGSQPPEAAPAADLGICLHESWLSNRAQNLLAGRRLDEKTLPAALSDWLGWPVTQADPQRGPSSGESPWAIALIGNDPLRVHFQQGVCEVVVGVESFSSDGSTYPAMNVTARYRIEPSGKLDRLLLADKLEVYPPGFIPHSGQRLGGRYQTYRRMLEKRIRPVFPAEIRLDRLRLDQPSATTGELHGAGLSIGDGWLSVGFKRAG